MAEEQQKAFGWKKTLVYSLLPLVALFAGLELAARVTEIWAPPYQADLGLGFTPESRVYVPSKEDPGHMVTDPEKVEVIFPRQRFRRTKPLGMLRIFALGGSSVHFLKHQFPAMAARLEAALGDRFDDVEIINTGGHAYGSHRLAPIAVEILDYAPDFVLVYSGHNEFEELEQMRFADLDTLWLQRLMAKSAFCRFVRDHIAGYKIRQLRKRHAKRILEGTTKPWKLDLTPEEKAARMAAFRDNLARIITLCRERGVHVVLGTVASNYWQPRFDEERDARRYAKVKALFDAGDYAEGLAAGREILKEVDRRQASDLENEAIRSLAEAYSVPLADVEAAIAAAEPHGVPGETLFRDECHLTEEGNALLAAAFEKAILTTLQ